MIQSLSCLSQNLLHFHLLPVFVNESRQISVAQLRANVHEILVLLFAEEAQNVRMLVRLQHYEDVSLHGLQRRLQHLFDGNFAALRVSFVDNGAIRAFSQHIFHAMLEDFSVSAFLHRRQIVSVDVVQVREEVRQRRRDCQEAIRFVCVNFDESVLLKENFNLLLDTVELVKSYLLLE